MAGIASLVRERVVLNSFHHPRHLGDMRVVTTGTVQTFPILAQVLLPEGGIRSIVALQAQARDSLR